MLRLWHQDLSEIIALHPRAADGMAAQLLKTSRRLGLIDQVEDFPGRQIEKLPCIET